MTALAQINPETWMEFARTFGFPALLVLLFLYGAYRVGRLAIEKVAVPMAQRLMDSTARTDSAVAEQVKSMEAIRDNLQHMNDRDAQTAQVLNEIRNSLSSMNDRIGKLESARNVK